MATVAAYIDGFNLYYGMKKKYGRKFLWLDVGNLVGRLRPGDQVAAVRYFTAIVKNEPAAAQRQQDYMSALRARNGALVTTHLGRFKDRTVSWCRRCRRPYLCACGSRYRGWEEKETDVALGAMMVADAARGLADTTLLVSADTDLAPALRAVRMVAPRQRIYLALPPGNAGPSRYLTGSGNVGHFFIRESVLRRAQLPDAVTDPSDGSVYWRPDKWR
jgi:uncharacterized LabA/DUF88 family protein